MTELEIAKKRIVELEALVRTLQSNQHSGGGNNNAQSEAMKDYEFNILRKWKDDDSPEDNYGGIIKHFKD